MAGSLADFRSTLRLHRAQLAGLMERRGVRKMHGIYEESRAGIERKLRALVRQGKGNTFTAHHYRMILAQVREGVHAFEGRLADHMRQTGRVGVALAHRHLIAEVKKGAQAFAGHTPVLKAEQAAVAMGLQEGVHSTLLRRYDSSARLYGQPTIKSVERQMAISLTSGESSGEAIDRVNNVIGGERWRAERIVRTEMSYTYGVTKQVGMEAMANEIPRLQKKLVATWDDRTGDDSKQLDGQTVDIDKPFIWTVKDSKGIPTGKVVRYMQPPNRPNDREVVVPWRPEWGGTIGGPQGGVAPADVGL